MDDDNPPTLPLVWEDDEPPWLVNRDHEDEEPFIEFLNEPARTSLLRRFLGGAR